MAVVITDLVLLIVIVAIGASCFSVISSIKDRRQANQELARKATDALKGEWEAKRFETNVPLICLNCEAKFKGPLTPSGCPQCNMSSLVITEEEYSGQLEQRDQ
jgi:hypothetical protein